MADIKVRFELNENANEESIGTVKTNNLTFANTSIKPNSAGVFNNMPTRDNTTKGINALTFGQELYFNENGMLDNVDNYGGGLDSEKNKFEIVWGVVNPNNTYNVKITFENAVDLKDIVIYGDKESKQFPTRAILDGTTEVFSDDYIWTLKFKNTNNTHTIEFTHWNRANYNAVLTFIGVMLKYIEIDKTNGLKSIESLSQSTGQPNNIFYGVIPSSGTLEIIDINREISDMIRDNIMPQSNAKIDVFVNNKQLQSHILGDNNYIASNFKSELDNTLSTWETQNYKGYQFREAEWLYAILLKILSPKYQQSEFDEMLDTIIVGVDNSEVSVRDYLYQISVQYPYISAGTLRQTIDKICTIAQLNVYQNDDGKIKFVSSRPLKTSNEKIISVRKKNQQTELETNLVVKNKYKSVNVDSYTTTTTDKTIYSRTMRYFNYDKVSQAQKDYEYVLNDSTINPGLTIIYSDIPSPNNPEGVDGDHWYYYMAKFDVSYDTTDLKILKNFHPKIADSVTMIFPNNDEQIQTTPKGTFTAELYDSSYSDEDIVNLWFPDGVFTSGNFDYKVRKNDDGTFTVFYVSLYLILSKDRAFVGVDEKVVKAIYNEISFEFIAPEISQSKVEKLSNAEINIEANELLQDKTKLITGKPITSAIAQNIIDDYSNGIRHGSITVNCQDYFDVDGNRIKDWALGQILEVGDVVKIDKDNNGNSAMKYADGSDMYFRITGRKFRYAGVPLLDLELQEVKVVS